MESTIPQSSPLSLAILLILLLFFMKKFFFSAFIFLFGLHSFGQNVLFEGSVLGHEKGEPLNEAQITVKNCKGKTCQTLSDASGKFKIEIPEKEELKISISKFGFFVLDTVFKFEKPGKPVFKLKPSVFIFPEFMVSGQSVIKAHDQSPTTFQNLDKAEIKKGNFGQDMPFLLNNTPGVVLNSDAGAGIGYTGIRIRGVDPTRINVTLNGIPLNDAESHGVWWVNMPDFASSTDNIQIQRGVGTSTNGAAAFGASINIGTDKPNINPYGSVSSSFGSFNSIKNTVNFGTGKLNHGWSFDGRLSKITSDGFIDRASSDLKSFFLSSSKEGKKSLLKINVFSGKEKTYQAWWGIPEPKFKGNETETLNYISHLYMSSADSAHLSKSGNKTYNYYTYPNETDNYQQDHYQVLYNYAFNKKTILNTGLHYTHGRGYYEQFIKNADAQFHRIWPVISGNDTVKNTDLIRQRWLKNHFFGGIASLTYAEKKYSIIAGGGFNRYLGQHFGEVIWATNMGENLPGKKYYHDSASKTDGNFYVKLNYNLNANWIPFLDLQLRSLNYDFKGITAWGNPANQRVNYLFFNPKAGLTYLISKKQVAYASFSMANREPTRDDLTQSTPDSRPKSEQLTDFEVGFRNADSRFSFSANAYYMQYKNQLALTGRINDVGAYTRINIPESYRAGIEFGGKFVLSDIFTLQPALAYSRNKIIRFTEYTDDWDMGTQETRVLKNKNLAFSPDLVASTAITAKLPGSFFVEWMGKYVGKQYLDNTQSEARKLDAFFVNNLVIYAQPKGLSLFKNIFIGLQVNNIFNVSYAPNGYSFSGISGGERQDFNYVYPQAGRNYMLRLELGF